jgi:hypothetical protein
MYLPSEPKGVRISGSDECTPCVRLRGPVERLNSSAGAPRLTLIGSRVDLARRVPAVAWLLQRAEGWDQVCDSTISTTGQAPPIVVEMTVAVVPRSGWWLDQNETPASAPDMVIWGESAFSQKPRP